MSSVFIEILIVMIILTIIICRSVSRDVRFNIFYLLVCLHLSLGRRRVDSLSTLFTSFTGLYALSWLAVFILAVLYYA